MTDKRTEREIIAEAYSDHAQKNWTAPVQGYPGGIPWPIHLEAYEAYCKKCSTQTALIDLKGRGCRGGFGTGELDMFVPGWRDRVAAFGKMKTRIATLEAAIKKAIFQIGDGQSDCVFYNLTVALTGKPPVPPLEQ